MPGYSAADVSVANEVWQFSDVERYDSTNLDSAVSLPDPACGLQVVSAITQSTSQPMTNDSVLMLLRLQAIGADSGYTVLGDAISYFGPFQPPTYAADTVPVFIVPYLGLELPNGDVSILFLSAYSDPGPGTSLAPSVWLGATYINSFLEASTLGHELGHLLLPAPPFGIFGDNSTAFLNIMDYPDGRTKLRRKEGFGLGLEAVATDDSNVRQLIEVSGFQNQCRQAYSSPNIVEVQTPPQ